MGSCLGRLAMGSNTKRQAKSQSAAPTRGRSANSDYELRRHTHQADSAHTQSDATSYAQHERQQAA
jgi:hypothetical protein